MATFDHSGGIPSLTDLLARVLGLAGPRHTCPSVIRFQGPEVRAVESFRTILRVTNMCHNSLLSRRALNTNPCMLRSIP